MRHLIGILVFGIFSILSTASFAGAVPPPTPVTTYSETDETVFSIGLRFELGDIVKPSIVGTVRRTETDTSNDVTGVLGEIALPVGPDSDFKPTVKAMGIFGNTDVQGLAGVGFDFSKNMPLLGLGVQGDYVDGGINISPDGVSAFFGGSSYEGPSSRKENIMVNK